MFDVGDKLFLRTVTYHLTGEIVERDGEWVRLKDAAWIADSGRFADALRTGRINEVEPVGEALVNLATVTDAFPWPHDLPTEQR